MKGMMLISFVRKPGAYINTEYPVGISKRLGITPSDIMTYYALHRMRNMKPNFLFVKIKGLMIASFYSGFNFKEYVGHPDKCISVILDNENPNSLEGELINLANEILPLYNKVNPALINPVIHKDISTLDVNSPDYEEKNTKFIEYFRKMFKLLEAGKIQPVKLEDVVHIEGGGATIATIDVEENKALIEKEKKVEAELKEKREKIKQSTKDISNITANLKEMEKEGLRDQIRELQKILEGKDKKIQELEMEVLDLKQSLSKTNSSADVDLNAALERYAEEMKKKDEELNKWRQKVAEINEIQFVLQDSIQKLTEINMQQSDELQKKANQIKELKSKLEKDKELKASGEAKAETEAKTEAEVKAEAEAKTEAETKTETKTEAEVKGETEAITAENPTESDNKEEISALKKKITELSSELEQTKELLEKSKHEDETAGVTPEEEVPLNKSLPLPEDERERLQKLEKRVKEYKDEFVELKKTIKIQRREIAAMKKQLGLDF